VAATLPVTVVGDAVAADDVLGAEVPGEGRDGETDSDPPAEDEPPAVPLAPVDPLVVVVDPPLIGATAELSGPAAAREDVDVW
jgi:hypothetical protein